MKKLFEKSMLTVAIVVAVIVALVVVIVLANTIAIRASYDLITFLLSSPLAFAFGIPAIILLGLGWWSYSRASGHRAKHVPLFAVGTALGLGAFISLAFVQGYLNDRALYMASNVEQQADADTLSFAERVPFDVAAAVSSRSLGDTQGDGTGIIKSIPSDSTYTTSVIRRGFFQGYESVQVMDLPMYGAFSFNEHVSFCDYDESARLRLGGAWFNNSMDMRAYREVSAMNPTIHIAEVDSFATCEDGTPILHMPATKLAWKGLGSYRVPAGVVTYNGSTGELDYHETLELDGQSVYPITVARNQRLSTHASGSIIDYWRAVVGWEGTSKDGDDVNRGNSSEFSLAAADDNTATSYVSPLTPRGGSTSVVGMSTVDASTVERGKLNPLIIHTYDSPRQAPSTIASDLISTEFEGYRAEGLTVFEVVPTRDGNWTVSIGKDQSILYRALINPDGKLIEMTNSSGTTEEVSTDGESTEEPATNSKPLADMTTDELVELSNEVTIELGERARAGEAPEAG